MYLFLAFALSNSCNNGGDPPSLSLLFSVPHQAICCFIPFSSYNLPLEFLESILNNFKYYSTENTHTHTHKHTYRGGERRERNTCEQEAWGFLQWPLYTLYIFSTVFSEKILTPAVFFSCFPLTLQSSLIWTPPSYFYWKYMWYLLRLFPVLIFLYFSTRRQQH